MASYHPATMEYVILLILETSMRYIDLKMVYDEIKFICTQTRDKILQGLNFYKDSCLMI